MATPNLTEYERRRLDNIRRNDEMMKALNIQSKANDLSKQRRVHISKPFRPEKKPKTEDSVVKRRSLRTRGMAPDSEGLVFGDPLEKKLREKVPHFRALDFTLPISMTDAYIGEGSDQALKDTLLSFETEPEMALPRSEEFGRANSTKDEKSDGVLQDSVKFEVKSESLNCTNKAESAEMRGDGDVDEYASPAVVCGFENGLQKCEFSDGKDEIKKRETKNCVGLSSMTLRKENIARVVPGNVTLAKFLPSNNVTMIAAGNKNGNIGFWNVNGTKEGDKGTYLYQPHDAPLSGILFSQFCLSKMYTSCYCGVLRLMDVEKEVFQLLYSGDEAIFALSQRPSDDNNLYFSEGYGSLSAYDDRTGKFSHEWSLHIGKINSIDFSSENTNLMATGSRDGTACIWDLRRINANKPESLCVVNHQRGVHFAYFSPSAKFLATTSFDGNIGITTGANFEDTSMIFHHDPSSSKISYFNAIWGWVDSYLFVCNARRGVDVISPFLRQPVLTLESPPGHANTYMFDAHPCNIGMLAGATTGGQVYIWTPS